MDVPVNEAVAVVSYQPVVLDVPGRAVPLQLKVSAPVSGDELPVILLSHGHGGSSFLSSLHGYGPLADFWAAHGFVVVQPTHLDAGMLGLRAADDPQAPLYLHSRAADLRHVLDQLDTVEATVPGLGGRLDRERIAVVGHSLGGATAAMLLGMGNADPAVGAQPEPTDRRVRAGVVIAGPGNGSDLSDWARENYPALRYNDFFTMTTPALIVAGDADRNPMFCDRLSYRWDSYTDSPGPKTLLTVAGAEHMFGGISGYDAAETSDENPERVATLRALIWAYLCSALYPGDESWANAVAAMAAAPEPFGRVESK